MLLTGAEGYVGARLMPFLGRDFDVVGLGRRGTSDVTCDLRNADDVRSVVRDVHPDVILHAAGNKNLTECEQHPPLAYAANVTTTLNVLRAAIDTPVLYISSDYVFCGTGGHYRETSALAPRTAYGRSKMCAEAVGQLLAPHRFTAIRVSALYDHDSTFVRMLCRELSLGRQVDCFVDAYYSPTWFDDFARFLCGLIRDPARPSVVHVAGPRTTRFDFAHAYARLAGYRPELIRPVPLQPGATIFPDLSLDSDAMTRYEFTATPHEEALARIIPAVSIAEQAA